MGNMRQEMLGNKSKAGRLNQALHGVLSKRNITAAVIIGGMLLAACGNVPVAEVPQSAAIVTPFQPSVTETVSGATETPTLEVTPTAEAAATQEVAPVEQKRILMSEKIEYSGYQFDLEFSMLESDKITKSTFDKYEVESLLINENNPNARELLAKVIIYTFLETYNFQNKTNVSLGEYVANPGNYPAKVTMRDDEGKITEQSITLDQIKSFEMRYTSGLNGELYMNMPGQGTISSGYGFDNGKFILYTGLPSKFYVVDDNREFLPAILPYFAGYDMVNTEIRNALGLMPYTVFRMVDKKGYRDLNIENIYSFFDEITNTNPPRGLPVDDLIKWLESHNLFILEFIK